MRINAIRYDLASRIVARLGPETGGVAAAMTTGHEAWLRQADLDAMRDSGLAHILSISGLHMAIVGGFVFFAVRLAVAAWPWLALRAPGKKIAAGAGLVAVAAYLVISGGPPPAERAATTASIAFLAILLDRRAISMNALAVAAFVVLGTRPESVVQPGFQMSFAATAALVALAESWPVRVKEISAPRAIVAVQAARGWLIAACAASLVAGLATGPFAMQHFNRTVVYGLLANVATAPISSFVMMPALALGAALEPLGLGGPFLAVAGWGVEAMLAIGRFAAGLPGAVRTVASAPDAALPVAFLGVLFLCLWKGRARWLGLPLAAAVLIWPRPAPPDLWIGDGGTNAAIRSGGQAVLVRPGVRLFPADLWSRRRGLALIERQHDGAEGGLQRGPLEEPLEHALHRRPPLQLDHDAHAVAVRLVAHVAHLVDLALAGESHDLLDDLRLRHPIRHLGHDELLLAAAERLLHDAGAHDDASPPGAVHVGDPLVAHDEGPGRKVRTLHMAHQVVDRAVGIDGELPDPGRHLAQVVGRDVGAHPHRDPARSVDQQVGHAGREHPGLLALPVEVIDVVHRLAVNVVEQLGGDGLEAGLRVAVGGGRIAIDRAEVALTIDQRIPQREVLHHPHHGIVHGAVAVRVVLAQHIAHHRGRLLVRAIGGQADLVHGVEDPPVHRLEPVAHVGQRPSHDHAHRVVEKRLLHLVDDGPNQNAFAFLSRGQMGLLSNCGNGRAMRRTRAP